MKGSCELCSNEASIYCDSDEARLCWDCDEKVHSANFLVAKHCRNLLCHICKTPTQWKASGSKLGRPTISACETCFHSQEHHHHHHRKRIRQVEQERDQQEEREEEENDDVSSSSSSFSDSEDDYSSSCNEDEDEDENQVVPWSDSSSPQPPPPLPSTSSSTEVHGDAILSNSSTVKTIPHSDDEDGCSSKLNHNGTTMECFRPLKIARTMDLIQQIEAQISKPETTRLGIIDHYY